MGTRHRTYLIPTIVLVALLSNVLVGSEDEEIKVVTERNVPVPMRDGTILRADIHCPDRGGPYPVLVQRTLGGKDGDFSRFVRAGYIVVSQDVRGWGASEGERKLLHIERYWSEDGYVTVEWAAKLPGSTGKVGTFGRSNAAQQQWRLASLCPPSLVAMSAQSGIAPGHHHEQTGTIRPYSFLRTIIIYYVPHDRRLTNRPGVHTPWEALKLWERGESKKWVEWLPWLDLPRDVLQNQDYNAKRRINDPQWAPGALVGDCKNISVPNLDITGWYDHCNSDVLWFRMMVSDAKTEVARKGSKIIIGPWLHGRIRRHIGPIDFGPDATLDNIALQIRWFDYWLKGEENGVDEEPPVRIFVMGDNKWRDEQHWPPQRTEERILYITSNGHANTPTGDGRLAHQEPGQAGRDQYLYDPKDPVPTLSDPRMMFMPTDQRPLAGRKDILVYQTEPLRERVEVTGNPVVELYASSSAPDTDWFVRLIDVSPDGLAIDVSTGVVRARYREGFDRPTFIKPGEVVKYSIRMRPTSNAFLPGHRIRLDITSSDFPNFDRNHNTAVNQNADATLVVANQTIFHGGEYATRIILPWVPNPPKEERPVEEEKVEQESEKRIYPLHQAVAYGDIEQVRMLISRGININSKDEEKNTPLCYAVKADNMEMTKLLVDAGAEVNRASTAEQLPLYVAVQQNNIAIAEYLIDHGANVNAPEGWTPLQEAAYIDNNIEMIRLLITKGADINAGPWTPLHGAVSSQRGRHIVELLIRHGADINAKGKDAYTSTPLLVAVRRKNKEIAELLLANGAKIEDLNSKDERGLTALHDAAVEGNQEVAELLISKGANVDERDNNYEFTALHYAARFGTTKVAEVLIADGADIKAKDKWAYEPIHWAAYHDRPEVIELLIAQGADVNVKTSLDQTPLQLAKPRRNTGAIEVLQKHSVQSQSTQRVEKYIYKKTPQGELAIYVHFPQGWSSNDRRPAIVFFFGGGWRTGDVKQFVPQAEYLASRGMVAARADYRVKNRHGTSPDKCIEDGKSAVRWLRVSAAKLGIDPNRIAASGHSAGGHIAASTCTVKGLEVQEEDLSVSSKASLLILFEPAMACAPNMSLGLGREMSARMSQYHNLSKEVPPVFIYYGTNDYVLVSAGIDFIERSKELGNTVEVYLAEGQTHWAFQRSPWLERTIHVADKFLARYGYTRARPTIKLPEEEGEIKNMSRIDLKAYAEHSLAHTPLHSAARRGDKALAELLISRGYEVDAKDKWGCTPLHFAAAHGQRELIELLATKGADVNAKNEQGFTPLVWSGINDVSEVLVARGADVNAKDNLGRTVLYHAIKFADKWKAELLIAGGADVNAKIFTDERRRITAIHRVTYGGDKDMVELLIESGADLKAKSGRGDTPLDLAKQQGHVEIVELLKKHGAKE